MKSLFRLAATAAVGAVCIFSSSLAFAQEEGDPGLGPSILRGERALAAAISGGGTVQGGGLRSMIGESTGWKLGAGLFGVRQGSTNIIGASVGATGKLGLPVEINLGWGNAVSGGGGPQHKLIGTIGFELPKIISGFDLSIEGSHVYTQAALTTDYQQAALLIGWNGLRLPWLNENDAVQIIGSAGIQSFRIGSMTTTFGTFSVGFKNSPKGSKVSYGFNYQFSNPLDESPDYFGFIGYRPTPNYLFSASLGKGGVVSGSIRKAY